METSYHLSSRAIQERQSRSSLLQKIGLWGTIASVHKSTTAVGIDLASLFRTIPAAGPNNNQITYRWALENSGTFSTASLRHAIDAALLLNSRGLKTNWIRSVPSKVNIIVWKIQHRRLPTRYNLSRRGVPVDTNLCLLCGSEPEDEDHLFFTCAVAQKAIGEINKWWGINLPVPASLDVLLNWGSVSGLQSNRLEAFTSVIFTFCWLLWNGRNDLLFNNSAFSVLNFLDRVQAQSFFS